MCCILVLVPLCLTLFIELFYGTATVIFSLFKLFKSLILFVLSAFLFTCILCYLFLLPPFVLENVFISFFLWFILSILLFLLFSFTCYCCYSSPTSSSFSSFSCFSLFLVGVFNVAFHFLSIVVVLCVHVYFCFFTSSSSSICLFSILSV